MPVVGDVMGFCSWLFVEGFEEKRGVGRRGIMIHSTSFLVVIVHLVLFVVVFSEIIKCR